MNIVLLIYIRKISKMELRNPYSIVLQKSPNPSCTKVYSFLQLPPLPIQQQQSRPYPIRRCLNLIKCQLINSWNRVLIVCVCLRVLQHLLQLLWNVRYHLILRSLTLLKLPRTNRGPSLHIPHRLRCHRHCNSTHQHPRTVCYSV